MNKIYTHDASITRMSEKKNGKEKIYFLTAYYALHDCCVMA